MRTSAIVRRSIALRVRSSKSAESGAIGSKPAPFAAQVLYSRPKLRAVRGGVEQLLSLGEVAKALRVCRATAYRLCERGELPHLRVAKAIRVSPADLDTFIAKAKKGTT